MKVGENFFDLFTLGHIFFGIVSSVLITFLLDWIGFPHDISKLLSINITLILSLIWELFENCTELGFKFRPIKKKDTLVNSLSDILFSIIGSVLAFFIC
jgi:hypothetical protein